MKKAATQSISTLLVALFILSSCSNVNYAQMLGKQYDDFFRQFIMKSDLGQTPDAVAMAVPELNTDKTKAFLEGMAKEHAGLSVEAISLLGVSRTTTTIDSKSETIATAVYEYKYPAYYVLYEVSLRDSSGVPQLTSLNATASVVRAEERYPFQLVGVPLWNYVFILLVLGSLIFVVLSEISIFRLSMPIKTKVFWGIVALIGLGKIVLTWNDGHLNLNFLTLQIMFPSIAKYPTYMPWTIVFSFPIGALMYWYRRKSVIEKHAQKETNNVDTGDSKSET